MEDPFGFPGSSPLAGRAGELPAVESLREIEDVLAPLDRVERPRHLPEGVQQPADAVAIDRALAPGDHGLHVLQGVLQDAVGLRELGARGVGAGHVAEAGRVALRRLGEDETQRIGFSVQQRRKTERVHGRGELGPVAGERQEQPQAVLDRVRRDRRQVQVFHPVHDEVPRGPPRVDDSPGRPEREIEEDQEVATCRGMDRRVFGQGGHDRAALVEHVEARDDLRLSVVVDLEVFGLQILDGAPVLVRDIDGDLDERDARLFPHRRVLRLFLRLVGAGEQGDQNEQSDAEREGPGPAAHETYLPPAPTMAQPFIPGRSRHPDVRGRSRASGKARRASRRRRSALSRSPRIS